ncbi:MAG: tetratricopeptide repeat protein [Acetobacteraceae bacterium]|nr:tetratricopeptide repeat protein [Acetobacteraceae bacterium]
MSEAAFRAGIAALEAEDPAVAIPHLRLAAGTGQSPLARLNLGVALLRTGQIAEAEAALTEATRECPERAEAWVYRGQAAGLRGDAEAARACFDTALACDPRQVLALAGLAALAEGDGDLAAAERWIAAARAIDPLEPELRAWAARIADRAGAPGHALDEALAALGARPDSVAAARTAARALLALHGDAGASRHLSGRAAGEPFNPAWPLVSALLHAMGGRLVEAIAELRTADALQPGSGEIAAELGMALAAAGQAEPAEAALRTALAHRPTDLALRNRLATLLWKAHRFTEATALLHESLVELGPDAVPMMNLALLRNLEGRQEEALAIADEAVALSGGSADALVTRLCVLPYHPAADGAALRSAAEAAATRLPAPVPLRHGGSRDPGRRLRVGLLSGNLCCHPVGWLTIAGIEALPEAEFTLAAYSLRRRDDPISRRFRARCAIWREMGAADPEAIRDAVIADGIDILIDLGGYGEGGCPSVPARRAAPVQVKWVGSQFGTTGLPAMDWMLTDRWETPAGFERFYTEQLLRLPDGYVCYAPPPNAPAVAALPMLRNGHVTFGCFNNLAKLTQPVLGAWAAIMRALPDARLVLRTHALGDTGVRDAVRRRLEAAGIDTARVALHGGVPHRALLAAYGEVDIALDPFPYAGGLTVCEALWMGVPVVSLHDHGFASRHGLSHLSNVGLGAWSVGAVDDYVATAIARAQELDMLAELRAGLRERIARSPLCDATRFGRSLAAALRHAWQMWCAADGSPEGTGVMRHAA